MVLLCVRTQKKGRLVFDPPTTWWIVLNVWIIIQQNKATVMENEDVKPHNDFFSRNSAKKQHHM